MTTCSHKASLLFHKPAENFFEFFVHNPEQDVLDFLNSSLTSYDSKSILANGVKIIQNIRFTICEDCIPTIKPKLQEFKNAGRLSYYLYA